jgi:hypothetical protein
MSCDYTVPLKLYKGRDNAVTIVPYSDFSERINYNMTTVTRVVANADLVGDLTVGNSVVGDSAVVPLLVFWNNVAIVDGLPQWRIYCKVGMFTGIAAATYTLRITLYDPIHTNGLVLPDTDSTLQITIVELP